MWAGAASSYTITAQCVRKRRDGPVVLVVEEIFSVHEHIKDVCRRFANEGQQRQSLRLGQSIKQMRTTCSDISPNGVLPARSEEGKQAAGTNYTHTMTLSNNIPSNGTGVFDLARFNSDGTVDTSLNCPLACSCKRTLV